jgi:hypothetical protein
VKHPDIPSSSSHAPLSHQQQHYLQQQQQQFQDPNLDRLLKLLVEKVSISSTFYEQLLCAEVLFIAFLYLQFVFVFLLVKEYVH